MEKEVSTVKGTFENSDSFAMAEKIAIPLSQSDLVPEKFKGKVGEVMIALELANRTGVSPIMVMQNLHVIKGKPSWSSSFIIAVINNCAKFKTSLNFKVTGEGATLACVAYAKGKDDELYFSPKITMSMANAEGWVSKPLSKWKTMPELMIRYRAAAFFGRLYCPEILMGMQADDEINDVAGAKTETFKKSPEEVEAKRLKVMVNDCETIEDVEILQESNPNEDGTVFEAKKEELKNA